MEKLLILLLSATIVASQTSEYKGSLCDQSYCTCSPDSSTPENIDCKCSKEIREMYITYEHYEIPETARSITFSNCEHFHIAEPGINHNLERLHVHHMKSVSIQTLFLDSPATVILEEIENTTISAHSFFQKMNEVIYKNTYIKNIEKDSFSSALDIVKIMFENVTIGNIESKAVDIMMPEKSDFTITNSTIHNIESGALTLDINKFEISHSSLHKAHPDSFNVNATLFSFDDNRVQDFNNPFNVNSKNVEILKNSFKRLGKGIFDGISLCEGTSFVFMGNEVSELEKGFLDIEQDCELNVLFTQNKVNCSCQMLSAVFKDVNKSTCPKCGELYSRFLQDNQCDSQISSLHTTLDQCSNGSLPTPKTDKPNIKPTAKPTTRANSASNLVIVISSPLILLWLCLQVF